MNEISTAGITSVKKLFHNELVDVFPMILSLEQIHFWKENDRTLFSFKKLQRESGKNLDELSIEEITTFIAEQPIHKLSILSKSVERNGVQVPLIIRSDGKLLDGNRRYFACQWLRMLNAKKNNDIPSVLSRIPVMVIRKEDITGETQLKILAEANFIPDLKVAWPLDAQARSVDKFYRTIMSERNLTSGDALSEIVSIFGITKGRANDLIDTLAFTKEFINSGEGDEERIRLRGVVEERFVYFWEFRNKALKGRSAYKDPQELVEVKSMFFQLMAMGKDSPIKNVKQVEPLAQSKRYKTAWEMLVESEGSKLPVVVSMVSEKKEIRKAEDKIRLFHAWLDDVDELSTTAMNYLHKLHDLVEKKVKGKSS